MKAELCHNSRTDPFTVELDDMRAQGTYATSEVQTNAALSLAKAWLRAAHMDVDALDRDCKVDIKYWTLGDRYVPLYWVRWFSGSEQVASVELYEPTKQLRTLAVDEAKYNLRSPLTVDASGAGGSP